MAQAIDDPTVQLDVAILGRDFRVGCRASERDALLQAVAHLDSRMREIRDSGKVTGLDRIAVMAALNIANDLLRERREPAGRSSGPSNGSAGEPIDARDARRRIRDMQAAIDEALGETSAPQEKLF
jgi:cell division protein ZapA